MKKTLLLSVLIAGLAFVMSSCGGGAGLEKGTLVDAEKISEIKNDSTNDGKRFAVEGYLHISGNLLNITVGEPQGISINSEPEGEGKSLVYVRMKYGSSANSFSIPDNFDDSDITFTDNEGKKHKYNEKAVYSFTAVREPAQKYNSETKEWVPTGEYNWNYENVRVDMPTTAQEAPKAEPAK